MELAPVATLPALRVRDEVTALEELVRHRDRLREEPAVVPAQIEDDALRALRDEVFQRLLDFLARVLAETDELHVTDVVADDAVP